MTDLKAAPGVAVGTTATTIYLNPANSGRTALVKVSLVNIDGAADAVLTACVFNDASPAGATQILPVGYVLKAKEGAVEVAKILEPGDSISATRSGAAPVAATVDVFWEPA